MEKVDKTITSPDIFKKFKKVAIVVDSLFMPGGAEKSMMNYLRLFPQAEIFTSVFFKKNFWEIPVKVNTYFHPGFITRFLFRFRLPRLMLQSYYNLFSPIAFESFDFKGYDLVISLSARCAKGVITPYDTLQIHYVLTPPRAEWDNDTKSRAFRSKGINRLFSKYISNFYRMWDYAAAFRADYTISQSRFIAQKTKKFYRIDSEVIYPGTESFYYEPADFTEQLKKEVNDRKIGELLERNSDFFLSVSRLYDYKRVDSAIKACLETGKELIVCGVGPDIGNLKKIAKRAKNIHFVGRVSDDLLKVLYSKAQALLFCGIEDFGLVPVEAMAQGCPVIALNEGGGPEIVTERTGVIFESYDDLVNKLHEFDKARYNKADIQKRAEDFSERVFVKNFGTYLTKISDEYRKKNESKKS